MEGRVERGGAATGDVSPAAGRQLPNRAKRHSQGYDRHFSKTAADIKRNIFREKTR